MGATGPMSLSNLIELTTYYSPYPFSSIPSKRNMDFISSSSQVLKATYTPRLPLPTHTSSWKAD